ncbi:MAG: hypothetical protein KDA85_12480, partial [Planctomycetaceae bacterium]|nr:hypothetical protein [Planctomycetaceae bacterium]
RERGRDHQLPSRLRVSAVPRSPRDGRHGRDEQGNSELRETYRGIEYHFAGRAEREEFLKDPAQFAPQNLGCDPVLLSKTLRAVNGSIRFGAFFDNRLYLFVSDSSKAEFKKNPLQFTRIRSAVRVEQLEGSSFQ